MGGETPELALEARGPQDASTKKLSECLKRIGDELDSNMELQRCGSQDPGGQPLVPFALRTWESRLPTPSFPRSMECRPTAPISLSAGVQGLATQPSTLHSQPSPPPES